MEALALRPRSTTEIVDAAFRICRSHYPALVAATAVVLSPALTLKIVFPGTTAFADLLENLLFTVSDGAIIGIASNAYLGRPADTSTGLRAVGGRVGGLMGAAFVRNFIVLIGLVLLVIPGLWALAVTFAVPMALVLEGQSFGGAFTRARALADRRLGHVLKTLLLLIVLVFGLMIGVGVMIGIASEFTPIPDRVFDLSLDFVLILLYPLFSVGGTILYYDLRIREEGFDIEMMAGSLSDPTTGRGSPATTPAPPA